ncbi:MAG: hypothetical protein WAW90_02450 [Minisyncoccia bacterium]
MSLVFLGIFFTAGSAYLGTVTSSARSARYSVASAQALALAEAGVDQAIYQMNQSGSYVGETNTALGSGVYTVAITNVGTNTKRITVTGSVPNATSPIARKTVSVLAGVDTTIISFNYGVQVGAGGVTMANGSKIKGNVYSDGSISGSGTITGDATVASGTPARSISGVTVSGNAWAHTLSSCSITKNATFSTATTNCSVGGIKYPNSADAVAQPMPISDTQISDLEATATAGGVTAGPYTINGTTTLGPQKINGDLTVNGTLTLSGVVWVKGNITFANNSKLKVSATTGNDGAILIADFPGSETTKGIVSIANNTIVSGNGSSGSYPMILSTNSGSTAITLRNNADSAILYASRGTVVVNNNAEVSQVTAYGVSMSNNTEVEFKSGLQDASFSNGAGGSWIILSGTYASH